MSKNNNRISKKQHRLRCPVCQGPICSHVGRLPFDRTAEPALSSQPGELTECDQCLTMLEYRGDSQSLSLRLAPRKRALEFNQLTREGREPSLPELVGYVMRYRQMPGR